MRHNKLIVVLGIWVIALAFLGFSESLTKFFLILTGFLLVVLAIKKKPFVKSDEDFIKQLDQTKNSEINNKIFQKQEENYTSETDQTNNVV